MTARSPKDTLESSCSPGVVSLSPGRSRDSSVGDTDSRREGPGWATSRGAGPEPGWDTSRGAGPGWAPSRGEGARLV